MNMPKRIMIDMETADTADSAAILTFGAASFGLPPGAFKWQWYERASLASNESSGRTISKSTMEWWNTQNHEERKEVFGGQQSIKELLLRFEESVKNSFGDPKEIELWSRGAGFDCNILQHAFLNVLGYYPFDFRKHMCQRALEALMPVAFKNMVPPNKRKHHALSDALYQAELMDVALRNISWVGGLTFGGA